eukprot:15049987-Alexandrium_andersonii.AAC.1
MVSSAQKYNLSAERIRASTLEVINTFCTPRRRPPGVRADSGGKPSADLHQHIINIIEHDNTDAASDE